MSLVRPENDLHRKLILVANTWNCWIVLSSFPGFCPPGASVCGKGSCYTPEQMCDFTYDCSDGTDEKDCGTSCSFENGRCGWKSSLADIFDWALGTGSVQRIRPPYDHTLMDENGTWFHLLELEYCFRFTRINLLTSGDVSLQFDSNHKVSQWAFSQYVNFLKMETWIIDLELKSY